METLIWAMAIDQAAVDRLLTNDFYGLLGELGEEFKVDNGEAIENVLRQYLLDRVVTAEDTFVVARQALVELNIDVKTAVQLINAVSIPKANNTSPSFRWNDVKIGYTREKLQNIIANEKSTKTSTVPQKVKQIP